MNLYDDMFGAAVAVLLLDFTHDESCDPWNVFVADIKKQGYQEGYVEGYRTGYGDGLDMAGWLEVRYWREGEKEVI